MSQATETDPPNPPGVHEKNGSYYWVHKHKWTRLCRVSAGRAQMLTRLHEERGSDPTSVAFVILEYLRSGTEHLAPATRKHYGNTGLRMLHHFGHYALDEIEPTHCAQFLKWCRDQGRATTGNREKAFMSSVYEFAMANGWARSNPWRGVRRNREQPSRVYVTHDQLTAEIDRAPPELQPLLGFAYLTGMRQTDLRLLRKVNIRADLIEWVESKTGKTNTMAITPTIRFFLDMAAKRAPESPFVFTSARKLPWSEWGLQSALRRFQMPFQFRSLRPKAQTDGGDKNVLGHTGALRERYTRRRTLSAVK